MLPFLSAPQVAPMPPAMSRYHRRARYFEMLARGGCIDLRTDTKDIVAWLDALDEEMSK